MHGDRLGSLTTTTKKKKFEREMFKLTMAKVIELRHFTFLNFLDIRIQKRANEHVSKAKRIQMRFRSTKVSNLKCVIAHQCQ